MSTIVFENCRLCQNNRGEHNLNQHFDLRDLIERYADINLTDDFSQSLPVLICGNCKEKFVEFNNFIGNVKSLDTNLKHTLLSRAVEEVNNDKDAETQEPESSDEDTIYGCEICNQAYGTKFSLGLHKRHHKAIGKYPCLEENCDAIYAKIDNFKAHKLTHEERRPFLCVVCGKVFKTKSSMTCHEKIHLKTKAYECEDCNLQFSVASNLRAHEKNHHLGFRYYCSLCAKSFVSKSTLERHENTHSGIKNFECDTCSAKFYTEMELKKHEKYHKGIKNFQCTVCLKTFYEKHHLIVHLRIHSGERPFECNIPGCTKSFVDNQKLKRHFKSKHTTPQ